MNSCNLSQFFALIQLLLDYQHSPEHSMSVLTRLTSTFRRVAEHHAKARTREQLLQMSDRQLADFGFSKIMLLEGVSAWPWRLHDEAATVPGISSLVSTKPEVQKQGPAPSAREIRQAIKELSAYSDRELSELGLSRGNIAEVVRFGRHSGDEMAEESKRAA